MRSLLTQLTESIGNQLAQMTDKNELLTEKLHLNDQIKTKAHPNKIINVSEITIKELIAALDKEDSDLSNLLKEFITNSDYLYKKYARAKQRTNSITYSSNGGCSSLPWASRYSRSSC